jgi:hypothetical protein
LPEHSSGEADSNNGPVGTVDRIGRALAEIPAASRYPDRDGVAHGLHQELEELDALLQSILRLVSPGGRAVIISFHSGRI